MNDYKNDYIKLINELNERLYKNHYIENLLLGFTYSTNGYQNIIEFQGIPLYNSENDSLSKYDYMVDVDLKEFLIKKFNRLKEELYAVNL